MAAAFRQARDYAHRLDPLLDRPPFLITCDVGQTFEFFADFSGQGRNYQPFRHKASGLKVVKLEDLLDPKVRSLFVQVWSNPRALDPTQERARVTRTIADRLADLSRSLERDYPSQEVAAFLSRMLFALFAKDVGLLPRDSVMRLMRECRDRPASFAPHAEALFRAMDAGTFSPGLGEQVHRFNGAFFRSARAFPLKKEQIDILLEAAEADWREVEPAIFGTLLEHALDPAERGRLGAHYTPRPYVERVVNAAIIDPLREDWDIARAAADSRLEQGDQDGARLELLTFHEQLTRTRVLDPACGTGNFLYVALELLHGLEVEVIEARRKLGDEGNDDAILASPDIKRGIVSCCRFRGHEVKLPALAARTPWG